MLGHRALSPEDYLAILKKRWWILAIPAIIFPIVAYAASYLVQPQYLSQTLVLVEQQKVPDKYVTPVIVEDISGRLSSMKEQILSRSRLQPILDQFDLFAGSHLNTDDRIDLMRKNIDIKPIQSETSHGLPGFFISFKANDAHTAQAVCAEITSMFVAENLRDRATQTEGTMQFLQSQLADAKRNLDEQDAKLAKFQQQYVGKLPGQEEGNMNMLNSLDTQLTATSQGIERMQQDRTLVDSMLAQATRDAAVVVPETQREAPVAQQAEMQQLLSQEADLTARYTDDYPDVVSVKRKIRDLRHQMAQSTAAVAPAGGGGHVDTPETQKLRLQLRAMDMGIAQKKKDQAALEGQIGLYQGRIAASPIVQEQYKNLTRDYQTAQTFYEDLLKKMNDSKMARDLESRQEGEQFRVMDAANLPDAPTSPKRPVFAAGGLLVGLLLGAGIIALIEYRDTTLRSERDIWAFTKLPTLAIVSLVDMPVGVGESGQGGRRWFGRKQRSGTSASEPGLDAPYPAAGR